ncbi:TPA: hypothetical protein DDZ86_02715 [Candidatus Dependentiae bacterium]|nr:MAG: hypothetical protein UW09_C0001G0105 [candidate division TM6 bacterium GW2011_GWF2_43_87]HBL98531.1 hypothetical protein [Candidatus Dependentiae bacterium]
MFPPKKIILLAALASGALCADEERTIIDEIRAIIYHANGSELILSSDIRPSLEGRDRTLRDIIIQRLMAVDAQSLHITVTAEDAERFLGELQRINGLSREAMLEAFLEHGFNYEEGIAQLQMRQLVDQIIDVRVRTNKKLIIQQEDVENYEIAHPKYVEASYLLQQVCIPQGSLSDAELEAKQFTPAELKAFAWESPIEVKESELADDKKFIRDSKEGTVVWRELVDEGLELTQLVKKTPQTRISAKERYDEISEALGRERFTLVLKDYEDSLLSKASIRFTRPEDKILVLEGEPEEEMSDPDQESA